MEESGEGLRDPKEKETPQEDQQSQLTWTLGGSQRLNHQPGTYMGSLNICSRCVVFMWVPQQLEQGLSLDLLPVCRFHSSSWLACLASVT